MKKTKCISKVLVVFTLLMSLLLSACDSEGGMTKEENEEETKVVENKQENEVIKEEKKDRNYDVVAELQAYDDVMPLKVVQSNFIGIEEGNWTEQWIKENLKIDVSETEVDFSDNFNDRVRTMISTGDVPDVIFGWDEGLFRSIDDSGLFLPLDEYLDTYMPRVSESFTKEIQDTYRAEDGNVYILPSFVVSENNISETVMPTEGLCINMDILEQTGLDVPKTTDEFYEYLVVASTLETAEGKSVIPFANYEFLNFDSMLGSYPTKSPVLLKSFGEGSSHGFTEVDDENESMFLHYDDPAYLSYLKYYSKLFREGLIDRDIFSMTTEQLVERMKEGRYAAVFIDSWNVPTANSVLTGTSDKPYTPIELVRDSGVNGEKTALPQSALGVGYALINKNVSDPARVAKYIEWQYTMQGVQVTNFGAPDPLLENNCWYYNEDGSVHYDIDLQMKWDAENYGWQGSKAGGWFVYNISAKQPLKITQPNEMGIIVSDDFNKKLDEVMANELSIDVSIEAMLKQPVGEWFEKKGNSLVNKLNENEVEIFIVAQSDQEVEEMFEDMMETAVANGYEDMKKEMYIIYKSVN